MCPIRWCHQPSIPPHSWYNASVWNSWFVAYIKQKDIMPTSTIFFPHHPKWTTRAHSKGARTDHQNADGAKSEVWVEHVPTDTCQVPQAPQGASRCHIRAAGMLWLSKLSEHLAVTHSRKVFCSKQMLKPVLVEVNTCSSYRWNQPSYADMSKNHTSI